MSSCLIFIFNEDIREIDYQPSMDVTERK